MRNVLNKVLLAFALGAGLIPATQVFGDCASDCAGFECCIVCRNDKKCWNCEDGEECSECDCNFFGFVTGDCDCQDE